MCVWGGGGGISHNVISVISLARDGLIAHAQ